MDDFDATDWLPSLASERDVFCPGCGYNIRGVREPRCPECGVGLTLSVAVRVRAVANAPVQLAAVPPTLDNRPVYSLDVPPSRLRMRRALESLCSTGLGLAIFMSFVGTVCILAVIAQIMLGRTVHSLLIAGSAAGVTSVIALIVASRWSAQRAWEPIGPADVARAFACWSWVIVGAAVWWLA